MVSLLLICLSSYCYNSYAKNLVGQDWFMSVLRITMLILEAAGFRCLCDIKRSCAQIKAVLPLERTIINRPFAISCVDYAGPFDLNSFWSRTCKITKANFCVFDCFSTKAIYLEPTSDLSTATFLAAFNSCQFKNKFKTVLFIYFFSLQCKQEKKEHFLTHSHIHRLNHKCRSN